MELAVPSKFHVHVVTFCGILAGAGGDLRRVPQGQKEDKPVDRKEHEKGEHRERNRGPTPIDDEADQQRDHSCGKGADPQPGRPPQVGGIGPPPFDDDCDDHTGGQNESEPSQKRRNLAGTYLHGRSVPPPTAWGVWVWMRLCVVFAQPGPRPSCGRSRRRRTPRTRPYPT